MEEPSQPRQVRELGGVSLRTAIVLISTIDAILLCATAVVTNVFYHLLVYDYTGDWQSSVVLGAISATLLLLVSKWTGLSEPTNMLSPVAQVKFVLLSWVGVALLLTTFLFLQRSDAWSRGTITSFMIVAPIVLVFFRVNASRWLMNAVKKGRLRGKRALLVGDYEELQYLRSDRLLSYYGVQEIARFELLKAQGSAASLQKIDASIAQQVISFIRDNKVDQIVLVLKWGDVRRRESLCESFRFLPIPVIMLPDRRLREVLTKPILQMGQLVGVELQRAPLSFVELALKRTLDLVLTIPAVLLLSPLLLMVAALVKLSSPGPVIFKQDRKGFSGRVFTIYKFRTMRMHDDKAVRQACRNDSRVTFIGRILRASSIDELPQLINVLRGEMSLIGPRPHAIAHDTEYGRFIGNYAFRHHVKPGISGWAQIHGFRGETRELRDMEERIRFDLWYINNWSIWLDCWILLRSCVEIVRARNAY